MATEFKDAEKDWNLFPWVDLVHRAALIEACQQDDEEVSAALARFDNETFGTCASCGETIDRDYLGAHPWAEQCEICRVGPAIVDLEPNTPLSAVRTRLDEEGGRVLLTAQEAAPGVRHFDAILVARWR